MPKYLIYKKEETKCNNIIKNAKKMTNFDHVTKENIKEHNPNWPQNPNHPYKMLIVGGSGSGKNKFII